MKIVWEPCIYGGNVPVPCLICGRRTPPTQTKAGRTMLAVIYDDQGRVVGEACRSCVNMGAQGINAVVRERCEYLQAQLKVLQDLSKTEVRIPSLEEELQVYLD